MASINILNTEIVKQKQRLEEYDNANDDRSEF